MKFNTTIFIILILLTFGCGNKNLNKKAEKYDPANEMYIIQEGNHKTVQDNSVINLKRTDFKIGFFNKKYNSSNKKFYAAKITFSSDENDFAKFDIGNALDDLACFRGGTGMATSKSGFYESIFIKKNAHNYLFYENESERRVNLIKDLGKNLLQLEFDVKSFYIEDNPVNIEESNLKSIAVAILIDRNLNGILDKHELSRFTIVFND